MRMQQHPGPGRRGDCVMAVVGDLVGIQVLRQAGSSQTRQSWRAAIFTPPAAFFRRSEYSEQAAAGAAPLLRGGEERGGGQKRLGDVNTSGRDVQH